MYIHSYIFNDSERIKPRMMNVSVETFIKALLHFNINTCTYIDIRIIYVDRYMTLEYHPYNIDVSKNRGQHGCCWGRWLQAYHLYRYKAHRNPHINHTIYNIYTPDSLNHQKYHICFSKYMHPCMHLCMHTYIHYITFTLHYITLHYNTYIPTYLHTYIHTYLHTYI